jgi:copper homeostasis protein (lipoprotein)
MGVAGFLLGLAFVVPPEDAVTGTALFRERMALSPDAVFEAVLEEVTRAGAPAAVVGRQLIEPAGNPPYAVRIPYDPARVDARNRYAVRATIRVNGELLFATDRGAPVLTEGAGKEVNLVLKRVPGRSTLPAGTEISGSFEGTLPCADCPGIVYRVDLFPDQVYYLRTRYLEETDGTFDEIGTWVLASDGKTLSLEGGREAPLYFAWTDGGRELEKLDLEGKPIESSVSHRLAGIADPAPLEPRLSMRGMFSYMADSPVFEECLTRRKLPVAMEADYVALERAYREGRAEPGQALLAKVEGRIVERVNMEGPSRSMLVVERFLGLSPEESCGARPVPGPLENTYWKLTELNGTEVVPVPGRGEAHLIFQAEGRLAGSDGCNRMFGSYRLAGETIQFGRMGGTLMACPEAVRDREFRTALGNAATWRILGSRLQLRGSEGALLARFTASSPR